MLLFFIAEKEQPFFTSTVKLIHLADSLFLRFPTFSSNLIFQIFLKFIIKLPDFSAKILQSKLLSLSLSAWNQPPNLAGHWMAPSKAGALFTCSPVKTKPPNGEVIVKRLSSNCPLKKVSQFVFLKNFLLKISILIKIFCNIRYIVHNEIQMS